VDRLQAGRAALGYGIAPCRLSRRLRVIRVCLAADFTPDKARARIDTSRLGSPTACPRRAPSGRTVKPRPHRTRHNILIYLQILWMADNRSSLKPADHQSDGARIQRQFAHVALL
jgi:hypothetical protein